jgi:hypothetical protein
MIDLKDENPVNARRMIDFMYSLVSVAIQSY